MSTAVKVSCDEFEAMIERGEFAVDDPRRYELIDGEIVEMPPPNPPHEEATDKMAKWSFHNLPPEEVRVRVQGTIGLPEWESTPLPDVTWLRELDYSARRPGPPDVLLVIEVSDSSLGYDRGEKADLYAAAGLADYWIVNIQGRCVEVLRDPGPEGYATKLVFYGRDAIRPLAFPDLAFPVSVVFPGGGEGGPAVSTVTRVSYDEFDAMIERGEFSPDDPTRYELIEGEILPMVAANPPHDESINSLMYWSIGVLAQDLVRVRVQQGIGIPNLASVPMPDLTWVRPRDYRVRRPYPEDILLIIEVSFSTLAYDRGRKARLYARAGSADYWIVNLQTDCVEVLRDPGPRGYANKGVSYPGDVICPLAFPEFTFPISLLFPEVDDGDEIETGRLPARPNGDTP